MCITECCDRGVLFNSECRCDIGFFGDECEDRLRYINPVAYYLFIGIFAAFFLGILLIGLKQLELSLRTHRIPSHYKYNLNKLRGCQYIIQLVTSPKNSIIILCICLALLKIIWLTLDPFDIYDGNNLIVSHLLTDCTYSILFSIYSVLLMVWYTLYDEISFNTCAVQERPNRAYIFKYYKDIMKVRLAFVWIIQLAISVFHGLRRATSFPNIFFVLIALLLINFIAFICEFFIYGTLLQKCIHFQLKKLNDLLGAKIDQTIQEDHNRSQMKIAVKLSPIKSISNSPSPKQSSIQLIDQIQEQPKKQYIEDIKLQFKRNKNTQFSKTIVRRSSTSTNFRQESAEDLADRRIHTIAEEDAAETSVVMIEDLKSSFMLEENQHHKDWQRENTEIRDDNRNRRVSIIRNTRKELSRKYIPSVGERSPYQKIQQDIVNKWNQQEIYQQITQTLQEQKQAQLQKDLKILHQIEILAQLGVLFEIAFGILSILILVTSFLRSIQGTLTYLYISSFLQFISVITVLQLFKDIKYSERMDLRWIQRVGDKKNDVNQNYVFTIPDDMKEEDSSKIKFENRINVNTYY